VVCSSEGWKGGFPQNLIIGWGRIQLLVEGKKNSVTPINRRGTSERKVGGRVKRYVKFKFMEVQRVAKKELEEKVSRTSGIQPLDS